MTLPVVECCSSFITLSLALSSSSCFSKVTLFRHHPSASSSLIQSHPVSSSLLFVGPALQSQLHLICVPCIIYSPTHYLDSIRLWRSPLPTLRLCSLSMAHQARDLSPASGNKRTTSARASPPTGEPPKKPRKALPTARPQPPVPGHNSDSGARGRLPSAAVISRHPPRQPLAPTAQRIGRSPQTSSRPVSRGRSPHTAATSITGKGKARATDLSPPRAGPVSREQSSPERRGSPMPRPTPTSSHLSASAPGPLESKLAVPGHIPYACHACPANTRRSDWRSDALARHCLLVHKVDSTKDWLKHCKTTRPEYTSPDGIIMPSDIPEFSVPKNTAFESWPKTTHTENGVQIYVCASPSKKAPVTVCGRHFDTKTKFKSHYVCPHDQSL